MMTNQNKFHYIFLLILTFVLSACAVGPNFTAVEVEEPNAYRFQDSTIDAEADMDWSLLFQDSVLQTLIDTALVNNHDIRIAIAGINESRAYMGMAKADMFPKFSYSASTGFGNSVNLSNGADPYLNASANVNWELVFWGKYRRLSEAAQAEYAASEFGLKSIQLSLIAQVANTYHSLLDYKNRLEIAERTLVSRTESYDIIKDRFEKGIVPEIDFNQAEIQMATAAAAVPVYQRAIAFSENALSVLLGQNPDSIMTNTVIESIQLPEAIPAGLPSDLLKRRPDILEAEQALKAQNAYIGVAQSMRFPSISLTGLIGVASPDLSAINAVGSIGADVFGPIFYFRKNKRRVDAEREKTEQMRLNYEKTVLNAFKETENALVSIETYKKELYFVTLQLNAAKNAARLSRQRYDGGVTSYLEVLDAENTFFDIELYHSELLAKNLEAHINLFKILGTDWVRN